MCFDLLHFAGLNLRGAPYSDRRRYLSQCLLPAAHLQLVHSPTTPSSCTPRRWSRASRASSPSASTAPTRPGERSRAWLKLKAAQSAEFLVGGYTRGNGAREPLGALLLGYRDGKALRYAGHVGSGLDDESIGALLKRTAKLKRTDSPFAEKPPLHRPTTWLEAASSSPRSATASGRRRGAARAGVRCACATTSHRAACAGAHAAPSRPRRRGTTLAPRRARAAAARPTRRRCRTARPPRCWSNSRTRPKRLELKVGGARIALTNLDRVYWPAAAQRGRRRSPSAISCAIWRASARFMLPHLKDRPLTMIRMPEGIDGERFFQKHWAQALPEFVESVTVFSEHKDERHRYLLANNLPTLLWLGQVGTLEFHVWHSRAQPAPEAAGAKTDYSSSLAALESSILNYPDYLVFDIDPYIYSGKEAKGAEPELNKRGFAVGKRVAFWLRALLREMSLEAIVKTSGKTGLHVFVPIERTVTFDEARHICETVGRHVMREHPQGDHHGVGGREAHRQDLHRLQHERARQDAECGLFTTRGARRAGLHAAHLGGARGGASRWTLQSRTYRPRLEKNGDRWHDVLETKQSLTKAFGVDREK